MTAVPAPNTVARPYRGLSVQRIAPPTTTAEMLDHVRSRQVYRRTAYMALRWTGGAALLAVRPAAGDSLFRAVAETQLLAGPDDVVWIDEPHVDVGNPSALAAAAARHRTPGALVYLVQGRYSHVNLIWRPNPVTVVVDEVVPPHPAKLVDMVRLAVDVDEDLPPVRVVARLVSLAARLKASGPGHYLLPCRGAGSAAAERSRTIDYLDDGPAERGGWTLLGCERSAQIHEHHYGDRPGLLDFCPADLPLDDRPRITKCCLLERGVEIRGRTAVVPWGATHREVAAALTAVLGSGDAAAPVAVHPDADPPA